jgi:hypothetical protein
MSKCKRCNRELKQHHLSGMGDICRMKADRDSAGATVNKIRVEPMFIRFQPRRSYLVFTAKRQTVTIFGGIGEAKTAKCTCSEGVRCEHIELIAQIDNAKYPKTEVAR